MDAIVIKDLTKKYKDIVAVNDFSLSVRSGELLSLLGVNGAGKTTLIKLLSCLSAPTSGDAFLNGKSIVDDRDAVKSMIAVSPQESAVAPGLSVRENLELIAGICAFPREKREKKINEMSELFGLSAVMKRRAGKLSGGWQRRLSIAMALICEPEILFLDEPTLGLDVIARSELWDIIRALKEKATIILTTHYMEEAAALSDRVAIMNKGMLLACDTVEGIKHTTGQNSLEDAFLHIVKEGAK